MVIIPHPPRLANPKQVRQFLQITPGDKVMFRLTNDGVFVEKVRKIDEEYLKALESLLIDEWGSGADNDAYNDL